jgi:glycosyltransferase involved in cell wall biosynthesis
MLDVLAVIRAPLELYPPSLNQVSLLAEAGLRVGVVDTFHPDVPASRFRGEHAVERIRATQHTLQFKDKQPSPAVRLLRFIHFRRAVMLCLRRRKPCVVIAYDPMAMHAAGGAWRLDYEPKFLWHFHELFSEGNGTNWLTRKSIRYSETSASRADLVVFPDNGRARVFSQRIPLSHPPTVVMNCPRRLSSVPEDKLRPQLRQMGFDPVRVVYFQGDVSSSRCPETMIKSMAFWPANAILVLVGPVQRDFQQTLTSLAQELGLVRRVVFLGSVPYSETWNMVAGGDVGCALVHETEDPCWIYSAGAINKRFEYMAVGLPQVANLGPGMKEIIQEPDCGMLADPTSPDEVGRALARLLEDSTLRRRMSENARKAHLLSFNYEYQFATVLNQILGWCGKGRSDSDVP